MNSMHNRRGSVLLMAIGLLTILAILASTFLVISNLDSQETESLAVRAYADPIVEGLVAKGGAQIAFDRAVSVSGTGGPYSAMPTDAKGLTWYMDYPRPYDKNEMSDHWLSVDYVAGEGISGPGQLTNLEVSPIPANVALYKLDAGIKFAEGTVYKDGQDDPGNPVYVDTDGDGIPDAVLFDTKISSPLRDANASDTYYAAVRIVDLSSKICVNTAGGPIWPGDPLYGSGPGTVQLRNFLDNRTGAASAPYTLYNLLNEGDGASNKGRVGTASKLLQGYSTYCAPNLLSPASPGQGGAQPFQPFGIGEEAFFLPACAYKDNLSRFGGRINQMMAPLATTGTTIPDSIRRQLTTMSCVSAVVRWPDQAKDFTQPLPIDTVKSQTDCQLVYDRMKLMLEATGIGKTDGDRSVMAAHFAANLWAYCSNGSTGEPWKFTAGPNITVYGLRQDIVITQVFARHISNTKYDANDTNKTKDDSAMGFAIELSNPTEIMRALSEYELEIKSQDGTTSIVPVNGGTTTPFFTASAATAATPTKRVVYSYKIGTGRTMTPGQLFGEAPSATTWYQDSKLTFCKSTPSISITLYHKIAGERVPIDSVTIGDNASCDLPYDTKAKPEDISGDYPGRKPPTRTDTPAVYIRRDDYMKNPAGSRLARFNMAVYKCDGPTQNNGNLAGTRLGLSNNIAQPPDFNRCTYRAPVAGIYGPGIYRPRNVTVTVAPSARESVPTDDYFLPSVADFANIYLAGPLRQGSTDKAFTTGVLQAAKSAAFMDRADCGRIPTSGVVAFDVPGSAQETGKYPKIQQGYLFHEFFTRTPSQQARDKDKEKRRVYGLININTLPIPASPTSSCAAWWLPWPKQSAGGTIALNTSNRLALGQGGAAYFVNEALSAIKQYREQVNGFTTPGEVGIALAKYVDEKLLGAPAGGAVPDVKLQDADYIRTRNCLFGYISDCLSTRSDMFACYVTVQHGKNAGGRRWRYVAVIDRSNVVTATDKAAVVLLTQLP